MSVDLSKYLEKQKKNYAEVYASMLYKKYDSGWVDYVFPRLKEQEDSPRSRGLGLTEKEREAFWKNKLLRNNYLEMLKVFLTYTPEEYNTVLIERARYKINQSTQLFTDEIITQFRNKFLME